MQEPPPWTLTSTTSCSAYDTSTSPRVQDMAPCSPPTPYPPPPPSPPPPPPPPPILSPLPPRTSRAGSNRSDTPPCYDSVHGGFTAIEPCMPCAHGCKELVRCTDRTAQTMYQHLPWPNPRPQRNTSALIHRCGNDRCTGRGVNCRSLRSHIWQRCVGWCAAHHPMHK